MSGNCATGMLKIASRPARVMTIEMTNASRGLSMKILEIMTRSSAAAGRGKHRLLHDLARSHLLDAVDDHLVALGNARHHDHVRIEIGPRLYALHLDGML